MDTMIVKTAGSAGNARPLPATREACQARLVTLRDEIAAIRATIATADLKRQAEQTRMDPDWFACQKGILRRKVRQSAQIAAHMATLPGRKDALKDSLIAVLRADYDDDGWQRAMDEAHRRLLGAREVG